MTIISCFTNDNFKVLFYLFEIKGSDNYARITQQEIADELGFSRATINKIIKVLKEEKYIIQDSLHIGRYLITDKAIMVINALKNIERNERNEN